MPNSVTYVDQITFSRNPDSSIRNIHVHDVTLFFDDNGNQTGGTSNALRDIAVADVKGLMEPTLITQQIQIAELSNQLELAKLSNSQSNTEISRLRESLRLSEEAGEEQKKLIAELDKQAPNVPTLVEASSSELNGGLLAALNIAFDEAIPEDKRIQFAGVFARVRVLIQAGRIDLARGSIEATLVPPELEEAKTKILAALPATSA